MNIIIWFVQAIALMGAIAILVYDKRQSRHCTSASILAYVLFVLFGTLFLATLTQSLLLIIAILTAIMAITVINLVLGKGNVKHISAPLPPKIKPYTPRPKRKSNHRSEGKRHAS